MKKDLTKIKSKNHSSYEKEIDLRNNLLNCNLFNYEETKNAYILSLDPLIKKHAAEFAKKSYSLTFDDYVNEAYVRVCEKFDKFKFRTSNVRLSTYMDYQIIDAMQVAKTHNEQAYSCSTTNVKMTNKIKEYIKANPNLPLDEVSKHFNINIDRLIGILDSNKRSVSVFQKNSEDDSLTLLDCCSSKLLNSEDLFILKKSCEEVNKILHTILNEDEFVVIENHFGLNDSHKKTLQEIANVKKCTKENVRLIKERALAKMRDSEEIGRLSELLMKINKLKQKN